MSYLKSVCIVAFSSLILMSTGCSKNLRGNAMVLPAPTLVDVAVAADLAADHKQAKLAFLLAAHASDESAVDAAEAWMRAINARIPRLEGESGLEEIVTAHATAESLLGRIKQDLVITHDIRVAAMTQVERTMQSLENRADFLSSIAVADARMTAERAKRLFVNDREGIHDALVILAPFSVASPILSRRAAADVMKATTHILSHVWESEHRVMLINAGHVARAN